MVWPLTLKKHGLWHRGMVTGEPCEKPERRYPSSITTFHYWWRVDAGIKIVTFRIVTNTMAWNGKGWIQLFNVWRRRQVKKRSWIRSLPFHTIVLAAIWKATILTPASIIYQQGKVLTNDGHRCSGFSPGPPVTITLVSRTGFFKRQWPYHGLTDWFSFGHFFDIGHQWPYHGPSLWDCGIVIDVQV